MVVLRDGIVIWRILAPAGTTTLEIPDAPAAANITSLLGTSNLDGVVELCADLDTKNLVCKRFAQGGDFKLATNGKITGEIRDRTKLQGQGMIDFNICIEGKSSIPCVKTGSNGQFSLDKVPYTEDLVLTISKTGYPSGQVMVGRRQSGTGVPFMAMTEAELKADLALAKVAAKSGTGNLGIMVLGPGSGKNRFKVKIKADTATLTRVTCK